MQILLASAKIMKSTTKVQTPDTHMPLFHKEARQMALELGELSVENLAKELKCNDKIALENKLRYQDFFNEDAYLPALLAYYGQAYKYLKAEEYSLNDFLYADKHLWITSFLYGLLRPLDLIHPYRLEGKTKLPSAEGKNIFDYWRPLLKAINVYAKSCRGAMTSYIIRNQLTSYDDLLDFELDGFTYQPDYGDEEHPHFILRT